MMTRIKQIADEFASLPRGIKIAGGVAVGGVGVGIAYLFLRDLQVSVILLAIVGGTAGLFWIIGRAANSIDRRKGRGLGKALWERMRRRSTKAEGDRTREEAAFHQKLAERWRDVHQLLNERGFDFYSLPWCLIIGASQSGKTTVIQKSDQEFPIGDNPVEEFGSTKNCNWFFTNKAILIDTAGRYVEHHAQGELSARLEEDKQEWNDFLSLLMRYRPRAPINAVIAVLKVPDILEPDPEKRRQTAEMLRRALLDIEEELKIQCPVYVLVTMCDRLLGFVDFFSMLPGLSDRSAFGWSRPGPFDSEFDVSELDPGFAFLVERLRTLRVEFMAERAARSADDPDQLARIDRLFALPEEFAQLLAPLREMLATVFATTAYSDQHFLRGVYFTSGLQQGQPLVRACAGLLATGRDSGAGEDIATLAPSHKAYFIADFFEEKVFKEAGLAQITRRGARDRRRRERLALAAAAVVGIATTVWMTVDAFGLGQVSSAPLAALHNARNAMPPGVGERLEPGSDVIAALSGLRDEIDVLEDQRESKNLFWSGSKLADRVDGLERVFGRLYAEHVFDPLVDRFLRASNERVPSSWKRCDLLARALLGLHQLGGRELDTEAFGELLGRMEAVLSEERGTNLAFAEIGELGRRAAQTPETLDHLARAVQKADRRDVIARILADRILGPSGFWQTALEAIEKRPLEAKTLPDLENLRLWWGWSRLAALDAAAGLALEELTVALRSFNARSAVRFREQRQRWTDGFERFNRLRTAIAEHLETCESILGDAAAALTARDDAWRELETQFEQIPGEVARNASVVTDRLARGRQRLEDWLFDVKADGLGVAVELDHAEEPADPPPPIALLDFRARYVESAQSTTTLERCDTLVCYEPGGAADALDWREPEFWNDYSRAGRCLEWLDGRVPEDESSEAEGISDEVGRVARALDSKRDELRKYYLSSLFERLAENCTAIVEAARRSAAPVEASAAAGDRRARLPEDDAFSGLDEHGYGRAYSVAAATKVIALVQFTSEACERSVREKRIYPGARVDRATGDLLAAYFAEGFVPFWTTRFFDALDPTLPRPDALPSGDAPPWSFDDPVRQVCHQLDVRRATEHIRQLAGYAGAQARARTAADRNIDPALDARVRRQWTTPVELFWRRYADEVRTKELVAEADHFFSALRALGEHVVPEPGRADRTAVQVALLEAALERAEDLRRPSSLAEKWQGDRIDDPILSCLQQYSDLVRRRLGEIASEVFDECWAEIGSKVREEKLDTLFPFAGEPDTALQVATREQVESVFRSEAFQRLAAVVWPALPSRESPQSELFQVDVERGTERLRCFERAKMLADYLGLGDEAEPATVSIGYGDRSLNWSWWNLRVSTDPSARGHGITTPFRTIAGLQIPEKFEIRAIEADDSAGYRPWRSIHPFETFRDVRPEGWLSFLGVYYLNELRSRRSGGRVVRIMFVDNEDRLARERQSVGPGTRVLERFNDDYMELVLETSPRLPDELPDFGEAFK